VGNCLMPPLFGLIASHVHIGLLPVFLLLCLLALALGHTLLLRATNGRS